MSAPEVGEAVDVDVDADALGAVPGGGEAEVGHLGSDPRQGGQALDGGGDVGVVFIADEFGGLLDVSVGIVS